MYKAATSGMDSKPYV